MNLFEAAKYQEILNTLKKYPQEIQERVVYEMYLRDVKNTLNQFPEPMRKQFCVELIERVFGIDKA